MSRLPASYDSAFDDEESEHVGQMVCAFAELSNQTAPTDYNTLYQELTTDSTHSKGYSLSELLK